MSGAFLPIFFIRNITEYYNAVILTGFSDGFLYILLSGGEGEVAAGGLYAFTGLVVLSSLMMRRVSPGWRWRVPLGTM